MAPEPVQKPHGIPEIAKHLDRKASAVRGWAVLPVMAFPKGGRGYVSTAGQLMHLAESPKGEATVLLSSKKRRLVSSELKRDGKGSFVTATLKDWKGEPKEYLLQAPLPEPERQSDLVGRRAAIAGLSRPQAYDSAVREAVKAIEDGELSEASAFELLGRRMKAYVDTIVEIKSRNELAGVPKKRPKK